MVSGIACDKPLVVSIFFLIKPLDSEKKPEPKFGSESVPFWYTFVLTSVCTLLAPFLDRLARSKLRGHAPQCALLIAPAGTRVAGVLTAHLHRRCTFCSKNRTRPGKPPQGIVCRRQRAECTRHTPRVHESPVGSLATPLYRLGTADSQLSRALSGSLARQGCGAAQREARAPPGRTDDVEHPIKRILCGGGRRTLIKRSLGCPTTCGSWRKRCTSGARVKSIHQPPELSRVRSTRDSVARDP